MSFDMGEAATETQRHGEAEDAIQGTDFWFSGQHSRARIVNECERAHANKTMRTRGNSSGCCLHQLPIVSLSD